VTSQSSRRLNDGQHSFTLILSFVLQLFHEEKFEAKANEIALKTISNYAPSSKGTASVRAVDVLCQQYQYVMNSRI
jgi:hypothetical protein